MFKTKKIIYTLLCIITIISLLTVSVSANTYSYDHSNILNNDTVLSVTNGKNYSKFFKPKLVSTYDTYTQAYWYIDGYSPPTGSDYDNLSTNVYLRLYQVEGIYVKKGQRITIKFTVAYDGTIDYKQLLTTRLKIDGWNNVTPSQYIGYIPKGSKTDVEFKWDNTISECQLKYFDINFAIKNNKALSGDMYFEWFYNSLEVVVEDIPLGAQDIIDNQNQNAQDIIDNQNSNADKEIQAEQDLYEQEKQEAEQTGDESVDDALENMPNDSDGIIDSFGSFIGTMLHTNTDCSIDFPELKTPSIGGLPSYTLSEKQAVNFNEFEELIPKSIMLIVRSLLTIALIIFCYKELYSTIQYVVSLKKGGGD